MSAVLELLSDGDQSVGDDDAEEDEAAEDDDAEQTTPAQPALFTATDGTRHSLVQLHGSNSSTCGYCHATTRGRISFGLTASALSCADYQALIDVGWRRSGDFCYRPDNERGCCPNWTIRLKVSEFVASKAQRKVERRMQEWLDRKRDRGEGRAEGDEAGEVREERMDEKKDGKESTEAEAAEDPNIATLVSSQPHRTAREHASLKYARATHRACAVSLLGSNRGQPSSPVCQLCRAAASCIRSQKSVLDHNSALARRSFIHNA